MKRSPSLVTLSRDHHRALWVALQLKRAEVDNAASAIRSALDFFDGLGRVHFEVEEAVLLPFWLEHDVAASRPLAIRVLDEHLAIRTRVRMLRRGADESELHALGAALEGHVRFEERELFDAIEAGLGAKDLDRLGAEIAAAEAARGGG